MRAPAPVRARSHERRQHLGHRAQRPGREVGDLHRRVGIGHVLEHACPAEVVEVVAGALRVPAGRAEARDRAVHGRGRDVVRADAQTCSHSGPEPLQHDIGASAQRAGEARVLAQVAGHRLLAGPKRPIPLGGAPSHRVALGCLHAHHACAEPQQLAAGERPGQVAGELDDQDSGQRLRPFRHAAYSEAR